MKLHQLFEMPEKDLNSAEDALIKEFGALHILLRFTSHFNDRMIDGAKDDHGSRDNITEKEFLDFFKHLKKNHDKIFTDAAHYQDEVRRGEFEGVIRDHARKINLPFVLSFSRKLGKFVLTCKTILKKNSEFHTKSSDHVIDV